MSIETNLKNKVLKYPFTSILLTLGLISLIGAILFLPGQLDLFFALFLPILFGVIGSFALYEYKEEKKKIKVRKALFHEIDSILKGIHKDAIAIGLDEKNNKHYTFSIDTTQTNFIVTEAYKENVSEIGNLTEQEIEIITKFYSEAITISRKLSKIKDIPEAPIIGLSNRNLIFLNNQGEELQYIIKKKLPEKELLLKEEDKGYILLENYSEDPHTTVEFEKIKTEEIKEINEKFIKKYNRPTNLTFSNIENEEIKEFLNSRNALFIEKTE